MDKDMQMHVNLSPLDFYSSKVSAYEQHDVALGPDLAWTSGTLATFPG